MEILPFKSARKKLDLSVEALHEKTDIHICSIREYDGQNRIPNRDRRIILDALFGEQGIQIDWGGTEKPPCQICGDKVWSNRKVQVLCGKKTCRDELKRKRYHRSDSIGVLRKHIQTIQKEQDGLIQMLCRNQSSIYEQIEEFRKRIQELEEFIEKLRERLQSARKNNATGAPHPRFTGGRTLHPPNSPRGI